MLAAGGTSTGAIWGNDTCFARDAWYSDDYAKTLPFGDKHMILVNVLVGLSTQAEVMKVCPLLAWPELRSVQSLESLWSSTVTRPTPPTSSLTTNRFRKGRLLRRHRFRTRRATDKDTKSITYEAECSGGAQERARSGVPSAGCSLRQRQRVTIRSGCPANAESVPGRPGPNCFQPLRAGHPARSPPRLLRTQPYRSDTQLYFNWISRESTIKVLWPVGVCQAPGGMGAAPCRLCGGGGR